MYRKPITMLLVLVLILVAGVAAVNADPGQPNFDSQIYADGETWGTKAVTTIPAPNGRNDQSFDQLFVFAGISAEGQLPVGEAAPGNPHFNGGRWVTKTVEWTEAGLDAHDGPLLLTSYDEVMLHYGLGHLDITDGSPGGPGAPPDYFECPLLPDKSS